VLEHRYGLLPVRAQETHVAILLEGAEARLLHVAPGSPGLSAERVTYLATGRPLELAYSVMRGDRYKIVLDLIRPRHS
jgi:GntR family transcriptional regulator